MTFLKNKTNTFLFRYVLHYKTLTVLMGIATLRDTSVVSRDILEMVLYPAFIPEQSLNDLALLMASISYKNIRFSILRQSNKI